jgi:pimeloyl-ACP methyl ester carboxylesterase
VCHGFKGFKDWGFFPYVGERLAAAGFAAVGFNFAGSGIGPDLENCTELDRFAADTISQQTNDLGCVLDALAAGTLHPGGRLDAGRVALLGHSRGGAVAILRARTDRRVRTVVTWAGVSTLVRWSAEERCAWRERGFAEVQNARTGQVLRMNWSYVEDLERNADRLDVQAAAGGLEIPLLVVHGEDDESVPVREARVLSSAAPPGAAELVLLPHAGHTFGAVHPWAGTTPALEAALERTIAWFARHLAGTAARERSTPA